MLLFEEFQVVLKKHWAKTDRIFLGSYLERETRALLKNIQKELKKQKNKKRKTELWEFGSWRCLDFAWGVEEKRTNMFLAPDSNIVSF